MRTGCTIVFCSLVFAACATAPAAGLDGAAERIALLEQQVGALSAMIATSWSAGTAPTTATRPDDAALGELSERIGELSHRLDAARLGAIADAAARRDDAHDPATRGAITALRDALLAIDQLRAVCAENLANVNTPGWKRREVEWTTTIDPASGLHLPRVRRIAPTMTAGTLTASERALDVAIDGDGFFVCLAPDGERRYTRAGSLQVDAEGRLVTSAGMPLEPPCDVPVDTMEVSIAPTGAIRVRTASMADATTTIGSLQLARFAQPSALSAASGNTYRASDAAGAAQIGAPGSPGFGALRQGFLEGSNVQLVNELVNLQLVERQRRALVCALAGFGIYAP